MTLASIRAVLEPFAELALYASQVAPDAPDEYLYGADIRMKYLRAARALLATLPADGMPVGVARRCHRALSVAWVHDWPTREHPERQECEVCRASAVMSEPVVHTPSCLITELSALCASEATGGWREKTAEQIDKLTWQVRDTCTRAEKAEALLIKLVRAVGNNGKTSSLHSWSEGMKAVIAEARQAYSGTRTGADLAAAPPSPRQTGAEQRNRWPAKGDWMRFVGENGYDHEREAALKVFVVGQEYEVVDCDVGDWSHSIKFAGIEGRWNGVMFERQTGTAAAGADTGAE